MPLPEKASAGPKTASDDLPSQSQAATRGKRSDKKSSVAAKDDTVIETDAPINPADGYKEKDGILYQVKKNGSTETNVPLANFIARITADISEDDGAENSLPKRKFDVTARLGTENFSFTLPADDFDSKAWWTTYIGSGAQVWPGNTTRQHLCFAIRTFSKKTERQKVYTHLGWQNTPHGWRYLHAGGAVGGNKEEAVRVELPSALTKFHLPLPPAPGTDAQKAFRASLRLWEIAPLPLSVALHAAIYRATLGSCDFSLHLSGPSGAFKSEIAALTQQHYGPSMNSRNLPASWSSTANYLQEQGFFAKDALLTVDDFVPSGSNRENDKIHAKADNVLRSQGNGAGRGRMGGSQSGFSTSAAHSPRGLYLSTGEDVPQGNSLRGRILVLDVPPGAVNLTELTRGQKQAASGLFAAALSAFLAYIAPRYDVVQAEMVEMHTRLREQAQASAVHSRTPDLVASLAIGLHFFLAAAEDAGAITAAEQQKAWQAGFNALLSSGCSQAEYHTGSDPATRYTELLNAALSSGLAHLASMNSTQPPENPRAWGWKQRVSETYTDPEWEPRGNQVGWVKDGLMFLQPLAAHAAVKRMAESTGEGFPLDAKSVHKRLNERGWIGQKEAVRTHLFIRKTINGRSQPLLNLVCPLFSAENLAESEDLSEIT